MPHPCLLRFQVKQVIRGRRHLNGYAPVSYTHLDVYKRQDGVVLADVDVAGILIIVDGVHIRDVGEVLILAGSNDVHLAERCV